MCSKTMRDHYDPEQSASNLIHRLGRLIRQEAAQYLAGQGAGVTPEQWGLLVDLAAKQGASQASLADPVLKDHANITRMLDGLELRGLIKREPNPEDRRSHRIFLTTDGEGVVSDLLPGVLEQKAKWFDGMDRRLLEQLVELLRLIEGNIRDTENG